DHALAGWATLELGRLLAHRANCLRLFDVKEEAKKIQEFEKQWADGLYAEFGRISAAYMRQVLAANPDPLQKEAEALFEQCVRKYDDVVIDGRRPAKIAEDYLYEIRSLIVGKRAPDIDGADLDGKPLKLSDFRGKTVVLYFFSHLA